VFRWGAGGKNYHSIGPVHNFSLQQAREKVRELRKLVSEGGDPRVIRKAARTAAKLAQTGETTFTEVIDRYVAVHQLEWGKRTTREFRNRLRTYAEPVLGECAISALNTALVLQVLQPLWVCETVKNGQRLQQSIERIWSYAKISHLCSGDNPAQWKGHLRELLASPEKLAPVKHRAAMPYAEIPAFLEKLRKVPGNVARCLEFLILTATRRDEARDAMWEDMDGCGIWIIPAARMKMERAHRVPLSDEAQMVLQQVPAPAGLLAKGRIFPGEGGGRFGNSAMNKLLEDMCPGKGYTTHGFRSAFRDWAAEKTSFPDKACELALAHKVGNAVEAAYLRTDMLDERRKLMEVWGRFCRGSVVVPIHEYRQHG
jgi:integrase